MKTIVVISKKKYHEMCTLIATQREAIGLLEEQCNLLKKMLKKTTLSSLYGTTAPHDIDFPATEKLHEDKLY